MGVRSVKLRFAPRPRGLVSTGVEIKHMSVQRLDGFRAAERDRQQARAIIARAMRMMPACTRALALRRRATAHLRRLYTT